MAFKWSLKSTTEEDLRKLKLPKQAMEVAVWFLKNYGTDTVVEQSDLFKELDSHQEDNTVLQTTPRQPISRIAQFYRKRYADEGLFNIERTASERKVKEAKPEGEGGAKGKRRRKKDEASAEEPTEENTAPDTTAAEDAAVL